MHSDNGPASGKFNIVVDRYLYKVSGNINQDEPQYGRAG